jgi:hypothetical protein
LQPEDLVLLCGDDVQLKLFEFGTEKTVWFYMQIQVVNPSLLSLSVFALAVSFVRIY